MNSISIIIPDHNEKNIDKVVYWLKHFVPDVEIIVSRDYIGHGKGWAIREGLKKCKGDVIGYIDGDMDIHPMEIAKLLSYINQYDIVIANKEMGDMSWKRQLISSGYRWFVKCLFKLPLNDTQTGLKLYHRRFISDFKTNGFGFDIELLAKAHKMGARIKEVPIKINMLHKNVKLRHIWTTFRDTIRVKFQL